MTYEGFWRYEFQAPNISKPAEAREIVQQFSLLMESTLRQNDYKGGWDECSLLWLTTKLMEESGELAREILRSHWPDGTPFRVETERGKFKRNDDLIVSIQECADVAVVAMMISDLLARKLHSEK